MHANIKPIRFYEYVLLCGSEIFECVYIFLGDDAVFGANIITYTSFYLRKTIDNSMVDMLNMLDHYTNSRGIAHHLPKTFLLGFLHQLKGLAYG